MTINITPVAEKLDSPKMNYAGWTHSIKRSVLREMLAVVSRPGILSFAGGLPAPELFPAEEFSQAVEFVLAKDPRALQYGPPYLPLKRHIVELMSQRGVTCYEDQVFVTTGAQQALNVLTRLFLNHGGEVIVEELVYTGMQQALSGYGANVITVPTDLEKGMDVNAVEFHLADGRHPAFLYAIPYAHNPLGVSITTSRAAKVVELAHTYGVPIVEDDPYGFLSYDDEASLPLRALDDQWVIYVGSFSKILAPALRLGWMVVPKGLIQKLTVLKEALDLETSALIQRSVSAYLDAGHLPGHLARLRKEYRIRRDTMLASMERLFPSAARWTTPSGGMFIWVELPVHINTTELLRIAVEDEQVAFIPGSAFSASSGSSISGNNEQPDNCLRLNFSNSKPDDIEQGMAGLGRILHRFC